MISELYQHFIFNGCGEDSLFFNCETDDNNDSLFFVLPLSRYFCRCSKKGEKQKLAFFKILHKEDFKPVKNKYDRQIGRRLNEVYTDKSKYSDIIKIHSLSNYDYNECNFSQSVVHKFAKLTAEHAIELFGQKYNFLLFNIDKLE